MVIIFLGNNVFISIHFLLIFKPKNGKKRKVECLSRVHHHHMDRSKVIGHFYVRYGEFLGSLFLDLLNAKQNKTTTTNVDQQQLLNNTSLNLKGLSPRIIRIEYWMKWWTSCHDHHLHHYDIWICFSITKCLHEIRLIFSSKKNPNNFEKTQIIIMI